MAPGARYGSRMLYTVDEKHMYRRQNIYTKFDRYICNAPRGMCRSVVNLSKPEAVARKAGIYPKHNHTNLQSTFFKNQFEDALKKACLASNGMVDPSTLYENQLQM